MCTSFTWYCSLPARFFGGWFESVYVMLWVGWTMCTSYSWLDGIGVRHVDGMCTPCRGVCLNTCTPCRGYVGICLNHVGDMLDNVFAKLEVCRNLCMSCNEYN